jgi:hypothetical protein
MALMSNLVMESRARWGEVATGWQHRDAAAVLDPGDGPRRHYWVRARGMAKTSDAAGILLALLVTEAPPRSRSFAYAADEGQAALVVDSIGGYVERSGLGDLVEVGARSAVYKATGATISIESSDAASAFGRRPWMVLVDELAEWPVAGNHQRLWAAIVSAVGKVAGARLLVATSAGSPSGPAHRRWLIAESSEYWRASLVPGPSPWWSQADVEAAREQLLPAEFTRLIECRWVSADDALATEEDVAACTGSYHVREPIPGIRYLMGLDIGTRRDATVLTVGHLEPSPLGRRVVIDRVLRWTGTRISPVCLGDVEAAVVAMWRLFRRPRLVYDPYQAAQLSERLKVAGVRCEEFTFSTAGVNRLARTLFAVLRDRAIVLPEDPDLLAELGSVRLVETGPGMVRIDHHAGQHDDQVIAIGLVTQALLDRPVGMVRFEVPQGRLPLPARHNSNGYKPPLVVPSSNRRDPSGGWRPGHTGRNPIGYMPPRRRP